MLITPNFKVAVMHEVTLNNVFQSCTTLRHELEEQLGVVVSKSTVHRWLHALGYVYGRKHFVNQARSYRNALIRSYIYRYAAALQEQEEGTAIIVYMDKSYIHAHHCTQFCGTASRLPPRTRCAAIASASASSSCM